MIIIFTDWHFVFLRIVCVLVGSSHLHVYVHPSLSHICCQLFGRINIRLINQLNGKHIDKSCEHFSCPCISLSLSLSLRNWEWMFWSFEHPLMSERFPLFVQTAVCSIETFITDALVWWHCRHCLIKKRASLSRIVALLKWKWQSFHGFEHCCSVSLLGH